ncbi:hypothetical protein ACUR5C_14390 [Aliikangiella sp. IMCC44653]
MQQFIVFNPLFDEIVLYFALVAVASLLSYSCYLSFKSQHHYRVLICCLHAVISVALLGILLAPKIVSTNGIEANVIHGTQALRTFLKANHNVPQNTYYLVDQSEHKTLLKELKVPAQIESINYIQQVLLRQPEISRIKLYGEGLNSEALAEMEQVTFSYQPNSKEIAISDVKWSQKLLLGERFWFSGKLILESKSKLVVKLLDPSNQVVATLTGDPEQNFTLYHKPKLAGLFEYHLVIEDQDESILYQAPLPVEVEQPDYNRVFILQSKPSFETRYLQNWAADQGASVLVKTKRVNDTWATQRINFSSANKVAANLPLDAGLTEHFDIMLTDFDTLMGLNTTQLNALYQSVQQGLGLLLISNNSGFDQIKQRLNKSSKELLFKSIASNFQLTIDKQGKQLNNLNGQYHGANLSIDGVGINSGKLVLKTVESVFVDRLLQSNDKLLAASYQVGAGRVSISTIEQSFEWQLQGNQSVYADYWSYLIAATARQPNLTGPYLIGSQTFDAEPSEPSEPFGLTSRSAAFIIENRKTELCVYSEQALARIAVKSGLLQRQVEPTESQISLEQHPVFKNVWCGLFIAKDIGWSQVVLQQTASQNSESINLFELAFEQKTLGNVYVFARNNWREYISQLKQIQTNQFAQTLKTAAIKQNHYQPISAWVWMLLFITSFSLIWWLEKRALLIV